jgi:hypothetical protein
VLEKERKRAWSFAMPVASAGGASFPPSVARKPVNKRQAGDHLTPNDRSPQPGERQGALTERDQEGATHTRPAPPAVNPVGNREPLRP